MPDRRTEMSLFAELKRRNVLRAAAFYAASAKVADLKVISRTSTQHFKSSPDDGE